MSELLFIHGAGSSADFWHLQRHAFPAARYLDLPGLGRARQEVEHPSIQAYADWVAKYVLEEGLRGVVVVGHSMGGGVALALALARPGWLRGLVLVCTGARLPISPKLLALVAADYPAGVEEIVRRGFAPEDGPLSYAQKVRRNGVKRALLRTPQAVALADYAACATFDAGQRLGEIETPTLVVAGSEDRLLPPSFSEELALGISHAEVEVVRGAGHMLPLERPDRFNLLLRDFLERIERPAG